MIKPDVQQSLSEDKPVRRGSAAKVEDQPANGSADAAPEVPQSLAVDMSAPRQPEDPSNDLLNVGVVVGDVAMEQGIQALAARMRLEGQSFLGDFARNLLDHAEKSEAQLFQDIFALFIANFKKGGVFVEVGTGDGKSISNTYILEKQYGWTGLVVEPNPSFLSRLQANRTCQISTDCVWDISGRTVKFMCTAVPEFSRLASLESDLHDADRNTEFEEIDLVTTSLNDVLRQQNCPKVIDYLSLDVEGAEYDILQTFNFDQTTINCLTVEHNWSGSRQLLHDLLSDKGFVRVFEHLSQWDDWYVQRSVLADFPAAAALVQETVDEPSPGQAAKFMAWATEAIERKDFIVAEALCLRAVEVEPAYSFAYRTLAELATQQRQRAPAMRYWQLAVDADPDDYWARIGLAEMLAAGGAIAEAVDLLKVARALPGNSDRAQEMLDKLVPKLPRADGRD